MQELDTGLVREFAMTVLVYACLTLTKEDNNCILFIHTVS